MTFTIRPVQNEDLSRICLEPVERRCMLPNDIVGLGWEWARDEERDVFLMQIGTGRKYSMFTYLFSWGEDVAVFELKGYCLFKFLYMSDTLLPRLEAAKPLIAEALKFSGLLLEGDEKTFDFQRVPHAEFLPYPDAGDAR